MNRRALESIFDIRSFMSLSAVKSLCKTVNRKILSLDVEVNRRVLELTLDIASFCRRF